VTKVRIRSFQLSLRPLFSLLIVGLMISAAAMTDAQSMATEAKLTLPDAPSSTIADGPSSSTVATTDYAGNARAYFGQTAQTGQTGPRQPLHGAMVIEPGQIATPMTPKEKMVAGLKNSVSLFAALGWLGAAGWAQVTNGSPNYGTDSGAFGERLGAAALRGSSEGIFSNSVLAPLFREDPRYYRMGKSKPFLRRVVYAGTRVLITRTDGGRATPNLSLIGGNLGGSALTVTYYPERNTSFTEVMETFGGSLGGSAIGFEVNEFLADALQLVHLKKHE
jgi:hypothetical protein